MLNSKIGLKLTFGVVLTVLIAIAIFAFFSIQSENKSLLMEVERHANQGVFVLRFRASRETVNRAIRWRVLQPRDLLPVDEIVPDALGTPNWWPPPWASKAETYHGIGHGPHYRHIEEWLLFHPDTAETVYLMVGFERP